MASRKIALALLLFLAAACLATRDPELKQCKHQCKVQRQFDEKERRDCERECDEYYKTKKQRENYERQSQREEEKEEEENENPFVFEEEDLVGGEMETGEGRVRVVPKFTERSELLRGIENFRVSIVEANPSTFVIPSHLDAEMILFVAQGMILIRRFREFFRKYCVV